MTADHFITLSAVLFTIGAVGVLVRRNAIVVFILRLFLFSGGRFLRPSPIQTQRFEREFPT